MTVQPGFQNNWWDYQHRIQDCRGGGDKKHETKVPQVAPIFFMTSFNRDRGAIAPLPPPPNPGSAAGLLSSKSKNQIYTILTVRKEAQKLKVHALWENASDWLKTWGEISCYSPHHQMLLFFQTNSQSGQMTNIQCSTSDWLKKLWLQFPACKNLRCGDNICTN